MWNAAHCNDSDLEAFGWYIHAISQAGEFAKNAALVSNLCKTLQSRSDPQLVGEISNYFLNENPNVEHHPTFCDIQSDSDKSLDDLETWKFEGHLYFAAG